MKLTQVPPESLFFLLFKRWTIVKALSPLAYLDGKDHAGKLAAGAAVGFRQEFKDIQEARRLGHFETRGNFTAPLPGAIDFLSEPRENLIGFSFVPHHIDGNPVCRKSNELALIF